MTREEKLFDVKVNPCEVATLVAGVIPEEVEYIVGNRRKTLDYTFTQTPCSYTGTYSMKQKNGSSLPDFINQLEYFPIFDIYTVDEGHVGNYTLTVTFYLDNVA